MRVDILSKADAARVREYIRAPDILLIWDIGTSTGLRISDILQLTAKQLTKADAYVKEQKTGKLRRIYVRKHIRRKVSALIQAGLPPDAQIFSVSRCQVWRDIKDAARRAGIKTNIGTHTMRKTYAKAYAGKHGIAALQQRLNHDKVADTLGYITSNTDLGLDEQGRRKRKNDGKRTKRKTV